MNTQITAVPAVTVTRTFAAPRDRVFAAWTTPEIIKQWFGPEGCRPEKVEVDLRAGGRYHFEVRSDSGEVWRTTGVFQEVTPGQKLVYTWRWENDPSWENIDSLVTVDFLEVHGGTEVRLRHEQLPSAESAGKHQHGWTGSLEKLAKTIEAQR